MFFLSCISRRKISALVLVYLVSEINTRIQSTIHYSLSNDMREI